jgi:hypothetical protein
VGEDVVVALEDAVGEMVVARELPDVLDGFELGRSGRQRQERGVLRAPPPAPAETDGEPDLLIIDELGFVPLSKTCAELLFELISQRYERVATLITSGLPFDEWTEIFGSERLTGALPDRLTHHVTILEMNGDSYRLAQSRTRKTSANA